MEGELAVGSPPRPARNFADYSIVAGVVAVEADAETMAAKLQAGGAKTIKPGEIYVGFPAWELGIASRDGATDQVFGIRCKKADATAAGARSSCMLTAIVATSKVNSASDSIAVTLQKKLASAIRDALPLTGSNRSVGNVTCIPSGPAECTVVFVLAEALRLDQLAQDAAGAAAAEQLIAALME